MPLAHTQSPLDPAQPLASVEQGSLDIVAPRLPKVSVDVDVSMPSLLAPVPGALFARKFCEFLARLEADDPGSGKTIGCLLEEGAIRNKCKNVGSSVLEEKSSKRKSKKSGSTRKASTSAS
jgi:hypothetical protein